MSRIRNTTDRFSSPQQYSTKSRATHIRIKKFLLRAYAIDNSHYNNRFRFADAIVLEAVVPFTKASTSSDARETYLRQRTLGSIRKIADIHGWFATRQKAIPYLSRTNITDAR